MKLKYPLNAACSITKSEIIFARCDRNIAICKFLVALGISVMIAALLTSCTLTVHPDGSRTYGTDPAAAAKVIEIYSAK